MSDVVGFFSRYFFVTTVCWFRFDSERFSDEKLKIARMANRKSLEGDADARLEAMFADPLPPEPIPDICAWEDGAEEVAKLLGAQVCLSEMLDISTVRNTGVTVRLTKVVTALLLYALLLGLFISVCGSVEELAVFLRNYVVFIQVERMMTAL